MANAIVALTILSIIGASIYKIVIEKRKGTKCVGCPLSGECASNKRVAGANQVVQRIAIKELT